MHVVSTHNVKALVGQVSVSYGPSNHWSSAPTRIIYKVSHVDLVYVIVDRLFEVKFWHFGRLCSARWPPLKRSRK